MVNMSLADRAKGRLYACVNVRAGGTGEVWTERDEYACVLAAGSREL